MRTAFKEWAIVVDALGSGQQIVILRKGGINEGRGGFQIEHPKFWLFPTLFHQQRQSVIATAQRRYDELAPLLPPDQLRVEYFAEVITWQRVDSLETVQRLKGQHIWRDEVVAERFDWGRTRNIYALAVRVFRLPEPVELSLLPAYSGCKSWIELEVDLDTADAVPVLGEKEFALKLDRFIDALESVANSNAG